MRMAPPFMMKPLTVAHNGSAAGESPTLRYTHTQHQGVVLKEEAANYNSTTYNNKNNTIGQ